MHPGMVIGIRNESQNLLKLIDAVRGHNARVLVEIIRKPAEHAEQKSAEVCVQFVEADCSAKTGREPGMVRVNIAGRVIITEQDTLQMRFIASVGKQKMEQIIKKERKTEKYNGEYEKAVESACELSYIVGVIYQHVKECKNDRKCQNYTGYALVSAQRGNFDSTVPVSFAGQDR